MGFPIQSLRMRKTSNAAFDVTTATHWRLRFPTANGAFLGIAEIEMRATVGGADRTTSTAVASSVYPGFPAADAFDNDPSTAWYAAAGSEAGSWVGSALSATGQINELLVRTPSNASAADYGPGSILVEYGDGTNWIQDTSWPSLSSLTWGMVTTSVIEEKVLRRTTTPSIVHRRVLPDLTVDSGAWTNFTLRMGLTASGMPNGGGTNRFRFALRGGNAEGLTINKCYVGVKGAGAQEFATTPTQVKWDGGSNSTTIPAGTSKFCDDVTLSLTDSDGVVISLFVPSGASAADTFRANTSSGAAGIASAFKAGDDASTVTPSGYTTTTTVYLDDLEIWSA